MVPQRLSKLSTALVLALGAASPSAWADAWQINPTLSLRQSYDDNFRLTDSKDKVWGTNLIASVKLSRLTEDLDINGLVRLDFVKYSGDTDSISDKNNQLFSFNIDKKYALDQLQLKTLLRRDTLLRSVQLYFDPGEVEIEPGVGVNSAVVPRNVRRSRAIIRPSWDHKFTERLSGGLEYRYEGVTYDNIGQGEQLLDYRTHTVYARSRYALSERHQAIGTVATSKFDPDQTPTSYNVALRVGVHGQLSETQSYGLEIGPRYSRVGRAGESDDTDLGASALAFVELKQEVTRYRAQYEHRLRPSSNGKVLETDELILNAYHSLSPRFRLSMRTRMYGTGVLGTSSGGTVKNYLQAAPALTYVIDPDWRIRLSYRFTTIERSNQSREYSNAGFISLNYSAKSFLDWF